MSTPRVDMTGKGAVRLGDSCTCDGFVYGIPYRVQSHVHFDHMEDFKTSKGFQDIYMSEATKALLVAEQGPDLPCRSNIHGAPSNRPISLGDGSQLELVPSEHMLGAEQVQVTAPDGVRLGYSGDFNWPLENVIRVDQLIVDSTYGSPDRRRHYSQGEVRERFVELVVNKLREGPVVLNAFRGTLERALVLLAELECPILATRRGARELEVYRRFGYAIGDFFALDTPGGQELLGDGRYIRLVRRGETLPESGVTTVVLSAYMSDPNDPVIEHSSHSYGVAMSDHADFQGTIDYVAETGATYVVTDNLRGGHGIDLANEIRRRLGVEACPSSSQVTSEWGA